MASRGTGVPMPSLAPLAIDTSDFAALRAAGQVYVDKTAYIQRMLEEGMRYVFLTRPRRFGKSLLVSVLAHLFGRTGDDRFQDLAIARAGFLEQVPRVPVLTLNMARVAGDTPQEVRDELSRLVCAQSRHLGFDLPRNTPPWGALDELFAQLHHRYGRIAVLVDEYDAPLTDMLGRSRHSMEDKQDIQAYFRRFYRVLKNWDEAVQFAFVTGVLHIEGAGLFSALNNLENISDVASWSGICGFTEREIDRYLADHLQAAAAHYGQSPAAMRTILRRHYNGYRFAPTSRPVYNPISYLTVLKRLTKAEDAHDLQATELPRPWLDLGKTQFLFDYMEMQGQTLRDIDFSAVGVRSAFDLRRPSLNALLYQTGFLTLTRDAGGKVWLDYPNWEVEVALQEGMFYAYLGQAIGKDSPEWTLTRDMAAALQTGHCEAALAAFDRILHRVTYAELKAESNFQIALHLVCAMCQSVLRVEAEAPTRRGRADIVVETRDTFYVFELKLNKSAAEALAQIEDRGYLDKYETEGKRIVGIGLNFVKAGGKDEREAWEPAPGNYAWDSMPGKATILKKQEQPDQTETEVG